MCRTFVAGQGQHRLEGDVIGNAHDPTGRSGTDRPARRIDLCIDLSISSYGYGTISFEERRGLNRIGRQSLTRVACGARGSRIAASIATTASTATISRRVNPSCFLTLSLDSGGSNIGSCPGSSLLSIGSV